MKRYLTFVMAHPAVVIAFCLALTIAAGVVLSRGVIATSMSKLFFGDSTAYKKYKANIREFGNDEILIVAFARASVAGRAGFEKLRRVVKQIEKMPAVREVDSVLNAQQIEADGEDLSVQPYGELLSENPDGNAELWERLRQEPLYKNLIISSDGNHIALIIEMTFDEGRPDEKITTTQKEIESILLKEGLARDRFHLVGLQAQRGEVAYQSAFSLVVLLPISFVILFVTVLVLFRQLIPVLITMGIGIIALIWTMALGVLIDREINILMAMVPAIIFVVTFSDVVHLISAYTIELSEGRPKKEAIIASGSEVGRACFYTSLTTFIGFSSMSFVPTPVFRQLGIVLGFGVAIALLIAMTLCPVLFSILKEPRLSRREVRDRQSVLLDRVVGWLHRTTTARPVLIVVVSFAVLATSFVSALHIDIDTDFRKRLSESNPVQIAEKYYTGHFAGTNFLDIFVAGDSRDAFLEPALLKKVASFQEEIINLAGVDHAISLIDLLKQLHHKMDPESPLFESRQTVAQDLLVFEMEGGEGLERFVNSERNKLRIISRLSDSSFRTASRIADEIQEMAPKYFDQRVDVEASGFSYLAGSWLDQIVAGQRRGLLFAVITIALMMIICLRSGYVGLLAMVPNLLPLVVLGGYLNLAWESVDSDTMMIGAIALGLGVDDTIHFLTRLRTERLREADMSTALYRTFHFTGRGIILTTIILAMGFLPYSLSDYSSTQMVGTLVPLTLVVALLADLFLVPALARLGIIRFKGKSDAQTVAGCSGE